MSDMDANAFFEEDEPVDKIKGAFERGAKGVTARPAARGQTTYLRVPWSTLRVVERLSDSTANKLLPH